MKTTKPIESIRRTRGCYGLALLLVGFAASAAAQDNKIVSRPLTPDNITDYGLPASTQTAGGFFNVGLGQPMYLEVQVPTASQVTGVQWTLTTRPAGSAAALAPSPLGPEVPIYNPGDREVNKAVSRRVLVPDVLGQYQLDVTITTATGDVQVSKIVTGAEFAAVGEPGLAFNDPPHCALCHSDKVATWKGTAHASAMERQIDGHGSSGFAQHCLKCHNLGYDTTAGADNGGFDDVAAILGWTFPASLEPGNWDAMPEALKLVSNVQCENCHGAGSQHSRSGGNPAFITMSTSSGDCGQCHEAPPYHSKNIQWNESRHAVATRYPTGESRAACVRCHSGVGHIDFLDGLPQNLQRTEYEAIVCATCHDPHDGANPHQLRTVPSVALQNGALVEGGGGGRICMNCHTSRVNGDTYPDVTAGSSRFGPHYGPQTDMLVGKNAYEYGRFIPSSAHKTAVKDSCVTCHMQTLDANDPAKNHAGEHTFKIKWDAGTPGDHGDDVPVLASCQECHGDIDSFDFARQDYDMNGVIEGVQTEVKGLMDRLGRLLPPLDSPTVTITSAYTVQQKRAAFNHQFVKLDGSYGVHNTAYTVNLLKASLADLTGDYGIVDDIDNDGLPDEWETQYFSGTSAQDANGDADGDGLDNAFELKLGTNPSVLDSDNDGFSDFAEMHMGTNPLDAASNPTVGVSSIFTAAEMLFTTESGKTYQLQRINDFGTGTWTNVGEPVQGNGGLLQHFISTRNTERGFYRVIEVQP